MQTALFILGAWLGIQLLFFAGTRLRCALWERRQKRNSMGILTDAQPFDCGNSHAKTAVLFVHGFVDVPKFFERTAWVLAESDKYFCRAIRVPGWGKYPRFGFRRERVDISVWQDAVVEEIQKLQAAFPRVCIVAHSLGGAIVVAVLRKLNAERMRQPDSLVLLAPLFKVSRERSPIFSASTWHKIIRCAFPIIRGIESPLSAVRVDEATEFVYRADKFVHRDILDSMFRLVNENTAEPLPPEIPTLLVLAEQEHVVDNAAALAKLTEWKNKEILRVDCEHPILMSKKWRKIAEKIAEHCSTGD